MNVDIAAGQLGHKEGGMHEAEQLYEDQAITNNSQDANNIIFCHELLTLIRRGGGADLPPLGKTLYISGTKSRIDLKPGCKFKFVVCLETYLKKLVRSDH